MQCPCCQADNREGRRFCAECGASLALPCAACGFSNEPGEKFCGGCGVPLTPVPRTSEPRPSSPQSYMPKHLAEQVLASRAALEGERKQVTVLFADMKGSLELLADRDPEEARKLLDPVLERMMEAVHRYEGTVNQVMGDGIMALFGAPLAHEDHAVRACYAALAMQEAMRHAAEAMRRSHGLELQIRVGLNSGEVVVRAIGNDLHMDYSAVGQTTHLAARMEQLAPPGSIRLTAATLRLVEGLVRVNSLGPVPVKGLAEPVEVFDLTGASAIRRRLQAATSRGLTRFVGRQTEFDALGHALTQAEAGHGQVIALVGEPGVGKSRLVYELIHSHRTQDWLTLESASVSYGKATPYFPVIDLLKNYVKIDGRDDIRAIRAKVTGQVLTLDEGFHDTIPALLMLLEALPEDSPFLQLDPLQRRQRILESLKRVFLRESQVQPLLLVFEDLHWIDSETQTLLDSLVESLPTARLLLLVNYRPEYQHAWGGKTYYTQLRLDPLPPESAEDLLQALLGDDTALEPLKELLIERTEGNPFFLEESVRTLVETGGLTGESGAYRLAPHVGAAPRSRPEVGNHRGLLLPIDIQVPTTVNAVLAARIDRLPLEEKRLLQTAAVIGTEVPLMLLQAIAEMPEEALYRGLAHLQAAEFLYETSLFPELVYTFKHALTHEVAYGGLLQERRRGLHARIVEIIEPQYSDRLTEQVERLAHHAFRGEMWDKAVTHLREAGAKAGMRSAYREGIACFEQALAALTHLPESRHTLEQAIDLRLDLHGVLQPFGEIVRMHDYLREAKILAEGLDDELRLGRVSRLMCNSSWMMGDYGAALEYGQRALATGMALGNVSLQFQANVRLAFTYQALGEYGRAIASLSTAVSIEGALARRRSLGAGDNTVGSRALLSQCLAELGAFAEGITHGEEGIRMAEALDHPVTCSVAYSGVGYLHLCKGDIHRAIAVLERGVDLCHVWQIHLLFPRVAWPLGAAYALSGRIAEALPLLERAVERATSIGLLALVSSGLTSLSEAYLLAGRPDDATPLAQRALEHARQHKERGKQAWALRLIGEIAMHCVPPEVAQAENHYRQALALAEELGMRPLVAHCRLGLGTLYAKTGRREQARAELSTAIELYRAMDMTFWLPQADMMLAQVV